MPMSNLLLRWIDSFWLFLFVESPPTKPRIKFQPVAVPNCLLAEIRFDNKRISHSSVRFYYRYVSLRSINILSTSRNWYFMQDSIQLWQSVTIMKTASKLERFVTFFEKFSFEKRFFCFYVREIIKFYAFYYIDAKGLFFIVLCIKVRKPRGSLKKT